MEYGMPFLIETESLRECSQLCHDLGLRFVELNMNFPQCQLDRLSADTLNELKQEFQIYYTIHLDENLNVCDFNPYVRDAYLRTVRDTIALAKKIDAPIINMHLAKGVYITLPKKRRFLFAEYTEEYYTYANEFLRICRNEIGDAPIQIAIENTDGFLQHEKQLIDLLLLDSHFGLTLDIGHSHAVNDIDLPFYDHHQKQLIHMHAHDAKGTSNHLALGDGEIDLKECFLRANKAGARIVLETKTVEALKQSITYIKTNIKD